MINIHFAWLLKAKNIVFNPGQKFCHGQFQFCLGQKMFCPSRRTRHNLDSFIICCRSSHHVGHLCLVLLLGQNIFCPGQNGNCPRQNFCPGLKTTFFAFKSHAKWIYLLKIDFQSGNFVLNDFWKQKMYFITLDNIFILDNFSFVQDKKYFVRAEGRSIRFKKYSSTMKNQG